MPRPAARRRAALPQSAEVCEPRTLLTTFVVTDPGDVTDADDGALTYREALLAAEAEAGADIITFAEGVDVVTLEANLPSLTGDLSVVADAAGVTIDHAGFAGLRLVGGEFAFSDVTFAGARRSEGAALLVTGGATLTVTGGAFEGNAATGTSRAADPSGRGGAVRADDATAIFTGTHFEGNAAEFGGAVQAGGAAVVRLTDVTAVRNRAGYDGGFLHLDEARISGESQVRGDARATVTGGYFALNAADDDGGAIHDGSAGGSLRVTGATFSTNAAGEDGSGGAVHLLGEARSSISDALFFRNDGWKGGAVHVARGAADESLAITDSTFTGNTAHFGGGLAVAGTTVSLVNVRMFGNAATESDGRFSQDESENDSGAGGAVFGDFNSVIIAEGGRYAQNRADLSGGAFELGELAEGLSLSNLSVNRNVAGGADAHFANGGAVSADPRFGRPDVSLENVFMARNRAEGEFASGGGLRVRASTLTVTDSNLAGNLAVTTDARRSSFGGNVAFFALDRAVFTDTFIRGGRADRGAGLFVFEGSLKTRFVGGGLIGNEATGAGGALRLDNGSRVPTVVTLDGVRVRGNRAKRGGVAFTDGDRGGSRLNVTGGTVLRNNRAEELGGAFAVQGRLTLDDVVAVGNRAGDAGDVAYAFEDGEVRVLDAVFRGSDDPLAGPGAFDDRR